MKCPSGSNAAAGLSRAGTNDSSNSGLRGSTAGSGPSGLGAHAVPRSADPGGDAPCAERWGDALEHAQTRRSLGRQPHDGGTSVAQARPEAASIERYIASNDPDFETKAADIIGLYLNPPAHAAVFCVDEKTAIQALDRKDPVLPLSPSRADPIDAPEFRALQNKSGHAAIGAQCRYSSCEGTIRLGTAIAAASSAARRPSISAEQPKSGIPSWRKVRSSSIPRESANVKPCRLRHIRSEARAAATICRASSTHAPSNFPSRPIDTSVTGTG